MRPIPSRIAVTLASSLVAIGALLRRDLSSGRRGATLLVARFLVVTISGLVAINTLGGAGSVWLDPYAAGRVGFGLFWALGVISLLLVPVVAVQALRRDRDEGTLDLLLLAGLGPSALALGRTLSTFLLFESLLLDALPAIAVFSFFGQPSAEELLWGATALTGFNASLSGLAVALSAWIRRAGPCVAFSLLSVVLIFFGSAWLVSTEPPLDFPTLPFSPLLLVQLLLSTEHASRPMIPVAWHLTGLLLMSLLGLGGAVFAGAALHPRRRTRRSRTATASGIARKVAPVPPRRARRGTATGEPLRGLPLSWLLRRGSAAARPQVQLLVLPVPVLAYAFGYGTWSAIHPTSLTWGDALGPELFGGCAAIFWVAGVLMGLSTAAAQVTGARERKEWESLLATARRGRALIGDLLIAAWSAAAVPLVGVGLFLGLTQVTAQLHHGDPGPLGLVPMGLFGCLATGALASIVGLLAGLVTRSQAGALGLAVLLAVGTIVWTWIWAYLLGRTDLGLGLDLPSRLSATALAACLVAPLTWYRLRRRKTRPGPGELLFDLGLPAALMAPPFFSGLFEAGGLPEAFFVTGACALALAAPLVLAALSRPDAWLGRIG